MRSRKLSHSSPYLLDAVQDTVNEEKEALSALGVSHRSGNGGVIVKGAAAATAVQLLSLICHELETGQDGPHDLGDRKLLLERKCGN